MVVSFTNAATDLQTTFFSHDTPRPHAELDAVSVTMVMLDALHATAASHVEAHLRQWSSFIIIRDFLKIMSLYLKIMLCLKIMI